MESRSLFHQPSHRPWNRGLTALLCLVPAVLPTVSWAHHAEFMRDRPFLQGLSMPVHGLDHLLAALAAGALAARLAARRAGLLLGAIAGAGLLAALINLRGISLPEGTLCAVLAMVGALVLRSGQSSVGWISGLATALVTTNAVELAELLPSNSGALPMFLSGCVLAIITLMGSGFVAGRLLQRQTRTADLCLGGGLLAASSLLLIFPEANELLIRWLEGL